MAVSEEQNTEWGEAAGTAVRKEAGVFDKPFFFKHVRKISNKIQEIYLFKSYSKFQKIHKITKNKPNK